MSYIVIEDFHGGLDARKSSLCAPAGTLTGLLNAHITQGGEVEKRKAFVPITVPAAYIGKHFGLQPAGDGLYLFGTTEIKWVVTSRHRTTNVATLVLDRASGVFGVGQLIDVAGVGGVGYNGNGLTILSVVNPGPGGDQTITYACIAANEGVTADKTGTVIASANELPSPLAYQVLSNPLGTPFAAALSQIVSSTVFGGNPWLSANFADGTNLAFYGGRQIVFANAFDSTVAGYIADSFPPLADFYSGQMFSFLFADGSDLAREISAALNASGSYTSPDPAGLLVVDIYSIPTTLDGAPYLPTAIVTSAAGTLTLAQIDNGKASVDPLQASATFQIVSAGPGTRAAGSVSIANIPNDGDTVTVDTIVYTFKTAPAVANQVKIGGSAAQAATNLELAMNGTGSGANYFAGTAPLPGARCVNHAANVLSVQAVAGGTAGNALTIATSGNPRITVVTFAGALDSQVTQIVVGGATNLLTGPVAFSVDANATASAVAAAITANVGSGYAAVASGNSVTIQAQVAGITPNGKTLSIQTQGTIILSNGPFSLSGSGFTLDHVQCSAGNILAAGAGMVYPQVTTQLLADFCQAVEQSINSGTATHGFAAHCPPGGVTLFLGKATTLSTDGPTGFDISVTPAGGQTGNVLPVTVTPLTVSLSTHAVTVRQGTNSMRVTAAPAGGVAPYLYKWRSLDGVPAANVRPSSPTAAQTAFGYTKPPAVKFGVQPPVLTQTAFVCDVYDFYGQHAVSEPVYVSILSSGK